MSYTAKVMNVMVASPSDVTRERISAQEVIADWNRLHAARLQLVLQPLLWELDVFPATGDRPQALVNKQLVDRADVLVAIFWTRLGSPTGKEVSGTVEEIRRMVTDKKPVMIYLSGAPVRIDSVDQAQYGALQTFMEEMKREALVHSYNTPEEFSKIFYQHLVQSMPEYAANQLDVSEVGNELVAKRSTEAPPTRTLVELSAEAATLLLLTADNVTGGQVIIVRSFGGTHIQANSTVVNRPNDGRSEAKWTRAVEELVAYGLLKEVGYTGELFEITYNGYAAADRLVEAHFKRVQLDSDITPTDG
jgi:hypothetical protein